MRRIILVLLLGSSLRAEPAAAAEPKAKNPKGDSSERESATASKRIVVDHFQGEEAKRLRSEVTGVLDQEQSVELISVQLLDAHRAHDLSVDGSAEGFADVARALGVTAMIRGRVVKTGAGRVLSLVVLNGHDGRRIGRVEFKAKSAQELREQVAARLWQELAPLIAQAGTDTSSEDGEAVPKSGEEPAADERESYQPPRQKKDSADEPVHDEFPPTQPLEPPRRTLRPCSWLEIAPRGGFMTRRFDYENERSGALRSHELRRAPMAALELTFYPGALGSCAFSSGIGIHLGYEQMFNVTSRVADQRLETTGLAARAELVLRVPLGIVSFEPAIGYYRRRFVVERDYVPDIDYQSLGPRLMLGIRAGLFVAEAAGSGRFVLDAGQLKESEWFPQSSGLGFEASGLLGVAPLPWLDVFVRGDLERYQFDLNQTAPTGPAAPPTRPNGIADGAYDHFASLTLGVRLRFSKPARQAY